MTAEITAVIVAAWAALFVAAWVWAVKEEYRTVNRFGMVDGLYCNGYVTML